MNIREAAVAGMFYPEYKRELEMMVKEFIEKAEIKPIDNLKAVISPHAGYTFSGKTMGYAFKAILEYIKKSETEKYKVIILAPIHAFCRREEGLEALAP